MKFIKTVIITLLVMAILFTGIFMAGRYGWKVFGFRACEEAAITSVDVSESAVTIKGFYPGSFPEGFCGCYTEELGGKLYVGFRFSAVFGIFETGDFHVAIPVEGEIDEVILKTGAGETSIWKRKPPLPMTEAVTTPPRPKRRQRYRPRHRLRQRRHLRCPFWTISTKTSSPVSPVLLCGRCRWPSGCWTGA